MPKIPIYTDLKEQIIKMAAMLNRRIESLTGRVEALEFEVGITPEDKKAPSVRKGPPGNMPSMAGAYKISREPQIPAHLLARSEYARKSMGLDDPHHRIGDIEVRYIGGGSTTFESEDLVCLTLGNGRKVIGYVVQSGHETVSGITSDWQLKFQMVGHLSETAGFSAYEPFVMQDYSAFQIASATKLQEVNLKPGNFQFEYRGKLYYGY